MPKIRVHQLAKELDLDSKKILEEATRHGIRVKNHMSSLSDADEMMLRAFLEDLRPKAIPEPKPEPERVELPPEVVREAPLRPPVEYEEDEPEIVEVRPPIPAEPLEIRARPLGAPEPEVTPEVAPAASLQAGPEAQEAEPAPQEPPPTIQAVPSATAQPMESRVVSREPSSPRRQAEILGRKELPERRTPAPTESPRSRTSGPPPSGSGGSGLIATRTEGGKRTFVNTGRGRGAMAYRPTGAGGPGGRGRGRGGRRRGRMGDRDFRKPSQQDLSALAPDTLTVELPMTVKGLSEKLGLKANYLIQKLFLNHKKMVKINDPLDRETVELLGIEFDCEITCREDKLPICQS